MKKILTPIAGLLLAALPAFSQSQSIDNFESGNLGKWTLVSGAADASAVQVFGGNFSLEMSENATLLLHKTFNGGQGRYEASFYCEGPESGFQLYFQYQDGDNYYQVSCQPQDTENPGLRLLRKVNGLEETLSVAPAGFSTGEWYELVVERRCDDQIVVLLGGTEAIAITDASHQAAGAVALGAAAGMVYADNLGFETFQPEIQILGDTAFCYEPTLLEASGDFASYQWSTGSKSDRVEIDQPGLVWLEVAGQGGCKARDSVNVFSFCPSQFFAPNIFSPNNDGVNDEFRVFAKFPPLRYELNVFNRWGVRVFQAQQADQGWDGTVAGSPAPSDTYLWMADMDGFTLTGTLMLIR